MLRERGRSIVTDSYNRGYSGQPRDDDTNDADYNRGRNDRDAGRPSGGGESAMHSAVYEASVETGRAWGVNPNRALRGMLIQLVVGSVIAGALAFVVTSMINLSNTSPTEVALRVGGVAFFLIGAMTWGQLMVAALMKRTLLGCLVWLILTGVLLWMLNAFVFHFASM
jgi:hypothetical protein